MKLLGKLYTEIFGFLALDFLDKVVEGKLPELICEVESRSTSGTSGHRRIVH